MFNQPNIYIYLILVFVGIFLVFLFYRKDTWIARGLRITSLIVLSLLLLEPVFFAFISREKLAVIIDTSKSMEPKEAALEWWLQRIDSLPVRKQFFWFDTTLYEREQGGGATDITRAIELLPPDIGSAVLLSDGIYTRGRDPSSSVFPMPIHTIPLEAKELAGFRIVSYRRNYYVYEGDTTILEVVIESRGLDGSPAWVKLMEDDRELSKLPILLPPDGVRKSCQLEYIPLNSGIHVYNLKVESEDKRDSLSFPVSVLERRIRVLFVSGRPSFNLKFIKLMLERDQNIEFRSIIELAEKRWLVDGKIVNEGIDIKESVNDLDPDVVFLENIGFLNIKDYVDNGGRCFLIGKDQLSPFVFGRRPDREGRIEFVEKELVRLDGRSPILSFFDVLGVKRGARILAEAPHVETAQGNMPVFAVMGYGDGEVYSFASRNLVPISFSQTEESRFWIDLVRWISQRGDAVHIETDKPVYRAGENVRISAETRDINIGEITLEIKSMNEKEAGSKFNELRKMYKSSPNRYELIMDYLPPGKYEYSSNVGDKQLRGEFYIEEPLPEDPSPYADVKLMTTLALNTGGNLILNPGDIRISMTPEKRKIPVLPSRSPILLILIISLLCVEWWYLRK